MVADSQAEFRGVRMRSKLLFVAASLAFSLVTGCKSDTGTGALAGGALGTGAGALVGLATGNPKTGAVVGGLLGTGVGAAIGADSDNEKAKRADELAIAQAHASTAQANAARGPLSMEDIIRMSQPDPKSNTRVSDDVICDYIRSSSSVYNLQPTDLQYLSSTGVSDRVIREMMATRSRVPAPVMVQQPKTIIVREPAPVMVYDPYYYRPYSPPPAVYIRGRF
jgi:hypothetical protein